jgi:aspartokinase/homoserine dehydrogenase 1
MSADPRHVRGAFVIPEISLKEAMELSYFGAEVIHPYTMLPAVERNIPLWIKNTLNPSAPGTRISGSPVPHEQDITGLASITNVALINVEGGGMLGIPGMASRVFGALASADVNIIMISQASSEHSICICIREHELERAAHYLREELREELEQRRIDQFHEQPGLEIVAVIGGNMRGRPGISGRVFSALGAHEVNVLAIAQGSSEMNISFVIDREDRGRALNVVHDAFFATV